MSKIKQNPLWYLFSKTWQYSDGNRKNVVLYWTMSIMAECVNTVGGPLIVAKMFDVVNTQGINDKSIKILYICLSLVLLQTLLSWAFHGPSRCIERTNAFKVRVAYSAHLLQRVITLPLEWHTDHHTGETTDKISKGSNALHDFADESFMYIRSIIRLVGSYLVLAYFSHSAALIVFLMILVSARITMYVDKILISQYKQLNKYENQVSESVTDTIQNISTIIVLRVEKLVFDAIMHKVKKPYELFIRNQRLNEIKWFMTSMCCSVMFVSVVFVFFSEHWQTSPGGAIGASFYILVSYLDRIDELFFDFATMYGMLIKQKTRLANSEELSENFVSESFTNHVLPKDWQVLDVRGLKFSYVEDSRMLRLDNVSFSAKRGEKIAFVGERGSGKTTCLSVMRDLRHPQEIKLSVDGKIIPEGFAGINRVITLIPQHPEILTATILHNITMGAEYEMDFVTKFTDMACFTEVARGLPNGFQSSIKEKGVNLSGGQGQCLALARGLLACHDKDIVLLDEPTASMDPVTELTVYQNIFREFTGKTIISTTHRLHLLPLFDRICVFDEGKIIASGTLPELMSSCPRFVSMWQAMIETAMLSSAKA